MTARSADAPAARALHGGCLCGAVRYRVDDAFEYAANCHCSQCRRATGSAFKPFGGIRRERFEITQGTDALMRFGDASSTHDARCGRCGSLLYSLVRDASYVHVTYGTLDEAPGLAPTEHIFAGSKAAWHAITDTLPQHERFG